MNVDIIACEDTRHTQNLLNHYKISKRLLATHAHNEVNSAKGIINLLEEGNDIAFVSDAGTPGISDPGSRLVESVRSSGFDVVPIPGQRLHRLGERGRLHRSKRSLRGIPFPQKRKAEETPERAA